jgi:hypothetical protein
MTLVVPIGHSQHEGAQILKRIAKVPIQPPPPVRPSWSIPRRLIYGLFGGVHEPPNRVHLLPQRPPLAVGNSRATSVLAEANCSAHLPPSPRGSPRTICLQTPLLDRTNFHREASASRRNYDRREEHHSSFHNEGQFLGVAVGGDGRIANTERWPAVAAGNFGAACGARLHERARECISAASISSMLA